MIHVIHIILISKFCLQYLDIDVTTTDIAKCVRASLIVTNTKMGWRASHGTGREDP
jgi:hypothetical protein